VLAIQNVSDLKVVAKDRTGKTPKNLKLLKSLTDLLKVLFLLQYSI